MKKLNILFVNLPTTPLGDIEKSLDNESFRRQGICMPLGIMYISSYLKKYGYSGQVGLIDYVAGFGRLFDCKDVDSFIATVARQDAGFIPDVIAFALLFSASYQFFERCLNILSRMWPEAVVIVGGVHATNSTKELLELEDVDYVIRGEAEISFTEFVSQLSCSENINVRGIYSKEDVPKSTELKTSDMAADLDRIPFPDWELVDMHTYTTTFFNRRRCIGAILPAATIFTTRGCPYQCTFCSSHTVHGRKIRYRSVENIIEEIRILHERYGIKVIIPEDDLFTVDRNRILKLLRKIQQMGISGFELQMTNGLSVNNLDEEIITELISCGMKICNLAIESGSEYVQKHVIKKNCNLKKAKRLVDFLKSKGVIVRIYFVIGFPGETKEQMQETADYGKSLKVDWCVFQIAVPLIGSEMYDQFIKMGCIRNDVTIWSKACFDSRQFDTPQMSADELNDFVYRANLDCNFINNPNKVNGLFEKAITIFEEIVVSFPFHIIAWYCIWECYKNLGYDQKAYQTETHIRKLIQTDKRASEMFGKYGNMMVKFTNSVFT